MNDYNNLTQPLLTPEVIKEILDNQHKYVIVDKLPIDHDKLSMVLRDMERRILERNKIIYGDK